MSIMTPQGIRISYDSENLIREVLEDIGLFGADKEAFAILEEKCGAPIITDYALCEQGIGELGPEEAVITVTLKKLLHILEEQDRII